jgi:hypothetical protein
MLAFMRPRVLTRVAFALALVAAIVVAFGPTYTTCAVSSSDGVSMCSRSSGVDVNGWWILVVASVPVVLTLIAMLIPRRGVLIASTALLWIGCVLGLLSVGIFFVPAAIVLTIAAARSDVPATASAI